FSSRRRHTRSDRDWSSDVCSSDFDRFKKGSGMPVRVPVIEMIEIGAEFFLGGRMRLDREAARRAIEEHVASPLGLDVIAAAWGRSGGRRVGRGGGGRGGRAQCRER